MATTAVKTGTEIQGDYAVEVTAMVGNLYRVTIWDAKTNQMLNRRKDVPRRRVEEIKALLIAELGERSQQASGSEPRSLGGDQSVSRRCHRGRHADCLGEWTAYPDQHGPCECACHSRPGDRS